MKKKLHSLTATLVCSLSFACATFVPTAQAADAAISTQNAWVRWLPNNLPAGGYVTLKNEGDRNVDLVDVSSDDYGSVMMHQTVSNGSTQKMVMVDKVTVPAHGSVSFAPGGYHLMLEEAKHKIAPGDTVHVKLHLSDGETLDTPFTVKSPAQK
ncbi:copper chaperone PCu(A)C [Paraburkholderia dinghuensis]|uniref:Copper chaperone PCu(A)C n=1 Tax=Paraburkholderia dinghuensis TaxID=2305225 RepID=A0A3N6Q378_9BURK|nr:copper chaperone PCu(A)C [Paraburkholderia dinghuensis]RQH09620.1 copper chaperone PCu(A)C [Paraburkholderia dinghuensis]